MPRACRRLLAIPVLICAASCVALAPPARAQTIGLAGLWPHENGRVWRYAASYEDSVSGLAQFTASLALDGSGPGAGGVTVQYLKGTLGPGAPTAAWIAGGHSGLAGALWRCRPELRSRLDARGSPTKRGSWWPFLLLGPAEPGSELGFLATGDRVGAWREAIADWSWTYLTSSLDVGARFTLQLVPDLVDDVFLHGEVQAIHTSWTLPVGTFDDVLVMSYVVDQGVVEFTNEGGGPTGWMRIETRGSVEFAMGQGPIHLVEETLVAEIECPGCPGWVTRELWSRGELTLASRSVPTAVSSFGGLKAAYER